MSKPNILGNALSNITAPVKPAKTAPAKPAPVADDDDDRPVGVMLRLPPADHRRVSDFARARGVSLQALMEMGLNKLLKAEGLAPIVGMPRPKGRRHRRG